MPDSNTFNKNSNGITTALLLAAEPGNCLQPSTDSAPRCFTEINGVSLLARQVRSLRQCGIERLVVIVGHLEHCLRKYLNGIAGDLSVEYITDLQYRRNNSLHSLWLARNTIEEPFLLIESDLFFEVHLLEEMLQPDRIAVSRMHSRMSGATVTLDQHQQLAAFQIGAHSPPPGGLVCKTVNMYSFSLPSWRRVAERLDRRISEGKAGGLQPA